MTQHSTTTPTDISTIHPDSTLNDAAKQILVQLESQQWDELQATIYNMPNFEVGYWLNNIRNFIIGEWF